MSTSYERTIQYDSGKDSVFNENAESLTEALDRELKFIGNQRTTNSRKLVSIHIKVRDVNRAA